MKDYYLLIGLNGKDVKIVNVNKFTSSVDDNLKPIRSIYLYSCGLKIELIICKKRYHCYNCNKIFIEKLNINVDKMFQIIINFLNY